jgi:GNAT superfamily N-acetyltransferase
VRIVTHREDPSHDQGRWEWFSGAWPAFMLEDPVCNALWHHLNQDFPAHQVYLVDEEGVPVGIGNAIPFAWDGDPASLPEGIDGVLPAGVDGARAGAPATALSAIQAVLRPDLQGRGLSRTILEAMAATAREAGLGHFVAPVRPTWKERYPLVPMERYARWTRDDGLPFDPWLRVHARMGAEILRVAHASMDIRGTVAEWERWTGMALPESGDYVVPGALVPVAVDREADEGRYLEPNVWMSHPL